MQSALKEVEQAYKGKIRIIWKNYPLPMHQFAKGAAQAAMVAQEEGKFWEFHDLLFQNQSSLDTNGLVKLAEQAGVSGSKVEKAISSSRYDALIQEDMADGQKSGVNATPTFFVNGRMLEGAQGPDAFKAVIDPILKGK